jgi:hypothetical protein
MDYPFFSPVLISWVGILGIIFIVFFFSYLKSRAKYRLLEKYAEKGQTLPPEVLSSFNVKANWKSDDIANPLGSGITLMCIGVALAVFFWAMQGFGNPFVGEDIGWLPAIGIFPFMTGLGRVLSVAFTGKSPEPQSPPKDPA